MNELIPYFGKPLNSIHVLVTVMLSSIGEKLRGMYEKPFYQLCFTLHLSSMYILNGLKRNTLCFNDTTKSRDCKLGREIKKNYLPNSELVSKKFVTL